MGDGTPEVVDATTGCALEKNCTLVQKLCRRAVRNDCGGEIGVLGTELLNEIFACRIVSWNYCYGQLLWHCEGRDEPFSIFACAPGWVLRGVRIRSRGYSQKLVSSSRPRIIVDDHLSGDVLARSRVGVKRSLAFVASAASH